jgi:hypothetical protein
MALKTRKGGPRGDESEPRIVAERTKGTKVSRELWRGLVRFNRLKAGPLNYSRDVLTVRGSRGQLLGGLILQSYCAKATSSCCGFQTARERRDTAPRCCRKPNVEHDAAAAA